MGDVASLEERRIIKEASDCLDAGNITTFRYPLAGMHAAKVINAYQNFGRSDQSLRNAFYNGTRFIESKMYTRVFPDFLDDNLYTWNKCRHVAQSECKIKKPEMFNYLLNEYQLTVSDTNNLFLNIYVQSFVDCWNGTRELPARFSFISKKEARKNLMHSEDGRELLFRLNTDKKISGFTWNGVIFDD